MLGLEIGVTTLEIYLALSLKADLCIPYDQAISLLGLPSRKMCVCVCTNRNVNEYS